MRFILTPESCSSPTYRLLRITSLASCQEQKRRIHKERGKNPRRWKSRRAGPRALRYKRAERNSSGRSNPMVVTMG
jgi:hypothetical protein